MERAYTGKEEQIRRLFAAIAPKYDLVNSIISLNLHKGWRAFAVRECDLSDGDQALDVGAGTLDLSIRLSREVGSEGKITGIDLCRPMLEMGKKKMDRMGITNIDVLETTSDDVPIPSNSIKAAICGFTLRSVPDVKKSLAEMVRVVQRGGKVVILDLAIPKGGPVKGVYRFYLHNVMPILGKILTGRREPYVYLASSVERFYSREQLSRMMQDAGLRNVEVHDLTFGIATVHIGTKV